MIVIYFVGSAAMVCAAIMSAAGLWSVNQRKSYEESDKNALTFFVCLFIFGFVLVAGGKLASWLVG